MSERTFRRDSYIDLQLLHLDDNLGEEEDEGEVEPAMLEALKMLVFDGGPEEENGDSALGSTAAEEASLDSHIWDIDAIEDTLIQAHLDEALAHSEMESRPLFF